MYDFDMSVYDRYVNAYTRQVLHGKIENTSEKVTGKYVFDEIGKHTTGALEHS